MESMVIHAEGDVRVEERPIPQLQIDEGVLVKVVSPGLCGSDVPRILNHDAHYYPITFGHEFSGYVESYSASVTDLQPGNAVACVPLLPCLHCPQYEQGYFSSCKQYQFVGSRSEGGNAEYVVVKRANLFRLPSGMSINDGAFIEPITVGLHAFYLAQGCEGKNVIIVGAGTIGLLVMQCARKLGAKSITAIDTNPQKLALAKKLGAAHMFNSREMSAAEIHAGLENTQFDQLVLETAGTPQTATPSIGIVDPRAQLVLTGTLHHDPTLASGAFGQILRRELTIFGNQMDYSSLWPGEEWGTIARLLTEKRLQLEPLIAHTGDAEDFASVIKSLHGAPMQGKILLKLS